MFNKKTYSGTDGSWTNKTSSITSTVTDVDVTSIDTWEDKNISSDAGRAICLATEGRRYALTTESKSAIIIIGYILNWVKKLARLSIWKRKEVNG